MTAEQRNCSHGNWDAKGARCNDCGLTDYEIQCGQMRPATAPVDKDVFDLNLLEELLDAMVDPISMAEIDEAIAAAVKAVDRLGKLVYMLVSRRDKFVERYGKVETDRIEKELKETFEMLGLDLQRLKLLKQRKEKRGKTA